MGATCILTSTSIPCPIRCPPASVSPCPQVFATVKSIRGVANPNIGFTCQLLQWQKRVATSHARLRMYRIASHCSYAPGYLVGAGI